MISRAGRRRDTRARDAERQRQRRPDGVAGRKSEQDRTRKVAQQRRDDLASRRRSAGFVAARHLAEHERRRPRQQAAQTQLRQHAIEPVRPLADFFEEQDAAVGRIERVRRAERREQLRQRAAEQQAGAPRRAEAPRAAGARSRPIGAAGTGSARNVAS